MKQLVSVLFAMLLLASSCSYELTGNIVKENKKEVYEDNTEINAYFCPRENCTSIIKNELNTAKKSLHCAFYDLDSKEIINAIAKKSHDADVKVVIDKDNYNKQITGNVKLANSKQYTHNKFCIIDDSIVFTGSTNPTNNDLTLNNNNLIIVKSGSIAKNYEDEFDELWNGVYSSGNKVEYEKINSNNGLIENYFCPEDNCKGRVLDALKNAKESIYFMTFSFTDEDIGDVILFKNLETKGIFETLQAGSEYSQYKRLKDFGVNVKKDKNKKNMHHKVFIIDNETVVTGSYNPTESANLRNDENILIIHNKDIARKFLKEFELLWN